MSVAPSYQLGYGSLPFCSPGKLRGRTFALQFHNALQQQPDHLFISSFNEFIAQPQSNPYPDVNTAFSVGVPWDPQCRNLWVDSWGLEYNRDIEPTVQGGDFDYQIMVSCLRVLKSGAPSCTDSSELCCQLGTSQTYTNVFSYVNAGNGDHRLSSVQLGSPWQEQCTPFSGPTTFCVQQGLTQGQSGPFIVWAQPVSPEAIPLYACQVGDWHFFSPRSDCEGQVTLERLGFVSPVRTSEMPRALNRCYNHSTLVHYHSLDIACLDGQAEFMLGYVR